MKTIFNTKAHASATPHLFAVVEATVEAFGDARHAIENEADYIGYDSAEDCVDDHAHRIMSIVQPVIDEEGWENVSRELGYDAQRWLSELEADVRSELYDFIPSNHEFES